MCTVDAADRVAYLHTIYSPAPSASREPALKTITNPNRNDNKKARRVLAATQTHAHTLTYTRVAACDVYLVRSCITQSV